MTQPEFDTLMNIVYSRWGAKSYPSMVVQRIWYFWKDLPQKSFEKAIYTLLDTQKYSPMPSEFKMLAYSERDALGLRKNNEPESKPSAAAKCWDCADSGNLFAYNTKRNSGAVFRCHCEAGAKRAPSQGVQWAEHYAPQYEKEPIYSKDDGNWKPQVDQSCVDMVNMLRSTPMESPERRKGKLENPFRSKDPGEGK